MIDQFDMSTASSESGADAAHRVGKATIVEKRRKQIRRRWLVIGLGLAICVAVIAALVGVFAFFKSTNSNLSLGQSNAKEALVAAGEGQPYYTLCVADFKDERYQKHQQDAFGLIVVRIDESEKVVTLLSIPAKISTRMSDGQVHSLDVARDLGGDKELIEATSSIIDAPISHFVYTNGKGIVDMIDALGGISMYVDEEIDDPNAGVLVIERGDAVLSGEQSLVYLRATNVLGGYAQTAVNRMSFTTDLAMSILSRDGLDFANAIGDVSESIYTDLEAGQFLSIAETLRPVEDITVYSATIPFYETVDSAGDPLYRISESGWQDMLPRFKDGLDPLIIDSEADGVKPSSVTVEVRNGSNTTGAAARLAEKLEGLGYKIEKVGNTDDSTIYPETLIVYTNSDMDGAAKAVARDMGAGRIVNGGDYYTSTADVIAIIGVDWMPVE